MKSRHYDPNEADSSLKNAIDQIKREDAVLQPSADARNRLVEALRNPISSDRRIFVYEIAAVFLIFLLAGSIWILKTGELRQNRTETTNQNDSVNTEEYMPLTYGLTPEESLQRVRVKLPRSALNQFGITLKQTRTREVTADLLVGESGVPYAIRVVQQN